MNRKLQGIATAATASLMAFTALSQETPNAGTGGTEVTQERSVRGSRAVRLGRVDKAGDLIGMEVINHEGKKLGRVDDIAVDLETGRIVQVVLSTGGFLGLFVMMVPVPPGALHHDVDRAVLHLDSSDKKLQAAPRFGMSNWADLGQSNQVAEAYRYHGQEPYFAAAYQPALGPDLTARLGNVQRAKKVMSVSVKNLQNQTLGNVENLMVDLPAGRVVAVIVSTGEFLGMRGELSAVPPAAFQFNSEQKHLRLDVSKEALRNAPRFSANQWPDFGQSGYVERVYRAYRIEPYFATNITTEIEHTARNDP